MAELPGGLPRSLPRSSQVGEVQQDLSIVPPATPQNPETLGLGGGNEARGRLISLPPLSLSLLADDEACSIMARLARIVRVRHWGPGPGV